MLVRNFNIECWKGIQSKKPLIRLLPIGTIAYIKCLDKTIRKCKLVSIETGMKYFIRHISSSPKADEWYGIGDCNDDDIFKQKHYTTRDDAWVYVWKVGGYNELLKGIGSTIPFVGTIYKTVNDAQFGVANSIVNSNSLGILTINNYTTDMIDYGELISNALNDITFYTGSDSYSAVKAYRCNDEGKLVYITPTFSIDINANGVHFDCEVLENQTYHKCPKDAMNAFKKVDVIDFDDEDDDTNVVIKKVKITIEVEETKVEKVNNFIKNL